jgi:hypothetical protein
MKRTSTSASRIVTLQKRNMAKHYREDLFFEQDAVIIHKYKKYTKRACKVENLKRRLRQ